MQIDFVYFDVGGVLVLDFSKTNKWDEMLNDLGVKNEDKPKLDMLFDKEELKYCAGEKDADTFIEILNDQFKLNLPKNYSFLDDFINRFEPNLKLGEIVKSLRSKYKMGLLTNMYPNMLTKINERGLLPNVEFDVVIDSSVIGLQKPQKEIYALAVEKAGMLPSNILYVENTASQVEMAESLGWNTVLYDPSNIEVSNKNILSILSSEH